MHMHKSERQISQLYSDHSGALTSYLSKKFYINVAEAEDYVQMTFTKLTNMDEIDHLENPRAYLYRIANNLVIDQLRNQDRHNKWVSEEQAINQDIDDTIDDPARISIAKQQLRILKQTIDGMSERRKLFIKQSRFENLSNVEIAKSAGVTEAAVRKHLSKALVELKHALDKTSSEVDNK